MDTATYGDGGGAVLSVQAALTKVMEDVREVAKNDTNTQQGFNFRGVDAVVNAVSPALRKHGVVVLPHTESVDYVGFTSSKGTAMMCARVVVTYRFVGPGGDSLSASVPGEAFDAGDKSTAKAMSVAFRTALLQALALPTDDLDPDSQSWERAREVSSENYTRRGESTVEPNAGQGSVTSPRDGGDEKAAQDAASPESSGSLPPDGETASSKETTAYGEGAAAPGEGAVSRYLSKDDQALLRTEYGNPKKALDAYRAKFGERIQRLGDVTYEMRDAMMEGASK